MQLSPVNGASVATASRTTGSEMSSAERMPPTSITYAAACDAKARESSVWRVPPLALS